MNLAAQAQKAAETIQSYKSNKVIMDFVTKEALEKVVAEIRENIKGGTTAKGVEMLMIKNKNIAARVEEYINIGLFGCYIASLQAASS